MSQAVTSMCCSCLPMSSHVGAALSVLQYFILSVKGYLTNEIKAKS